MVRSLTRDLTGRLGVACGSRTMRCYHTQVLCVHGLPPTAARPPRMPSIHYMDRRAWAAPGGRAGRRTHPRAGARRPARGAAAAAAAAAAAPSATPASPRRSCTTTPGSAPAGFVHGQGTGRQTLSCYPGYWTRMREACHSVCPLGLAEEVHAHISNLSACKLLAGRGATCATPP